MPGSGVVIAHDQVCARDRTRARIDGQNRVEAAATGVDPYKPAASGSIFEPDVIEERATCVGRPVGIREASGETERAAVGDNGGVGTQVIGGCHDRLG